ncbi:chaplin [Streptomyces alboniger]|uniref:Chaplin n=1 Tax=Streptomyces alboniger TaxID=132473 RepID=A0A5J6HAS0_STRAD|nr:chaplin [Streptomyces alboniger]QEV17219.1 chaplin [Streptomyces alboniger]
MRQVTRKGLITVAAATGVLAATGGYAHADSTAQGGSSNSPGVLSGNSVQAPVDVPVNVCGNTVNVVGVLNPAAGNKCVNASGKGGGSHKPGGGAKAQGHASDSPGVGSGNDVQLPVDVPVNVCGNSVTVVGLANPTTGNGCANESGRTTPPGHEKPPTEPGHPGKPEEPGKPGKPGKPGDPGKPEHPGKPEGPGKPGTPGKPHDPVDHAKPNHPGTQTVTQPKGTSQLAETGSSLPIGIALPAGAGVLLAGAVLYRRARAAA